MGTKLKLTAPLAITIAVIAFLYVEFAANFSFHWVTDGSLGNGLDMPSKFHLIIPAAFLTWGMFFVLGANYAVYGAAAAYYPSNIRGRGSGAAIAWGRLGAVIGPLIGGFLLQGGSSAGSVVGAMAPFAVVAGVAVVALGTLAKSYE